MVLTAILEQSDYDYLLTPLSIFSKQDVKTKNVSFRLTLTSQTHTLTTKEVSAVVDDMSLAANKALEAERV